MLQYTGITELGAAKIISLEPKKTWNTSLTNTLYGLAHADAVKNNWHESWIRSTAINYQFPNLAACFCCFSVCPSPPVTKLLPMGHAPYDIIFYNTVLQL